MKILKVLTTSGLIIVVSGLIAVASANAEGCHECAWDDELGSGCLLGCSIENPDCWGITNCQTTPTGCTGSGVCDPHPDFVSADGTVRLMADASTEDSEHQTQTAVFTTADGSTVARRICDATIVDRTYSAAAVATLRHSTDALSL